MRPARRLLSVLLAPLVQPFVIESARCSSAVPTLFCPQLEGSAAFALSMPRSAPIPIPFRLQSLGMSNNGMPAFTRALELILL